MDSRAKFSSVTEYIESQAENTKANLISLRNIILATAPNATELISYGMPAFKIHSVLVYFAANKNHIGFYPTAAPLQVFEAELSDYKTSKGAIQFPLNKGIPLELVEKIVKYRIQEDEQLFLIKNKKTTK